LICFHNKFAILTRIVDNDILLFSKKTKKLKRYLREITVKIGLERVNTQERILVKALLDK